MANLCETVYLEKSPGIDADKGMLSGVKLLGMESRNKRRYKPAAMKEAVSLYKGKKIYVDHPQRGEIAEGSDRSIKDWVGTIQNARFESDGIYGDVKLRTKSPYFAGIIEAAQDFPKDVGFSHVADGESKYEGETEIVESIREVFSVDLVADSATTDGFFESSRKPKKKTIKTEIESLPDLPIRKRLLEYMDAGVLDGAAPMEAEEPSDPGAQMTSIIKELIRQLGEALNALAAAKSAPPPPPVADPLAQPAPEDDMANEPDLDLKKDKEQKAAFESLQRENAELKAKSQLLESNREATPIRVKALARETDDKARQELLESWPALEEGERPARSPAALTESEGVTDFPRDPKKFAASLR